MSEQADFKIAYDGTWYHNGEVIGRAALVDLFAKRALAVEEDGSYWLKTPYERYPVEVEDVPFVIVSYQVDGEALDFTTNLDEIVPAGPDHPIELRADIPYIEVRDGLYARISRSVFYHLVDEFGASFTSRGQLFRLGALDA